MNTCSYYLVLMYSIIKHIAILAMLLVSLSACMPRVLVNHEQVIKNRVINNPAVKKGIFQGEASHISYRYTESHGDTILVFIHGTPGDWSALGHFLVDDELSKYAALRISLDRPGWGAVSERSKTAFSLLSMAEQSAQITLFMDSLREQYPQAPIILVGHSYGASLAARLLMDKPEYVQGVMLLAGPLDPSLAGRRWYHHLADTALLKKILSDDLNKANVEMTSLQADLTAMLPYWQSIKVPITIIQGTKDKLVPAANSDFIRKVIEPDYLRLIDLDKQGHFIPWERYALVVKELRSLLDKNTAITD